jgi:hypothetical protein
LTRDRLELLLEHCGDLAVEVDWVDLGARRRGEYLDDQRLIRLNTRLTRVQATATLAHEIGHAVFGDRCSTPHAERRAWEYGASLVITPDQYARAERLVGSHPAAIAVELEVTPRLVEAWREWFRRRYPVELRRLSRLAHDLA